MRLWEQVKGWGQTLAIGIAAVLLIWMVPSTIIGSKVIGTFTELFWALLVVGALVLVGLFFLSRYLARQTFFAVIFILLGIVVVKLILLYFYRLAPAQDFWNYHYFGYAKVAGIPWSDKLIGVNVHFGHVLNIAFFYSIIYALLGTDFVVAQVTNIVLSFFDALLIYTLAKRFFSNRTLAIFAALTFALLPAYFLYGFLNGAEPIFITLIMIMMVLFDHFLKLTGEATRTRWATTTVGLLIASILAYMLRPTASIWVVASLLLLIFARHQLDNQVSQLSGRQSVNWLRFKWYAGFLAAFFLFTTFAAPIYSLMYGVPVSSNAISAKYSLATGTSKKSHGEFNGAIYQIMINNHRRYQSPQAQDRHLVRELDAQINQNLSDFKGTEDVLKFTNRKYQGFAAEDYGYDWLLYNMTGREIKRTHFYSLKAVLISWSVAYFVLLLILSITTLLAMLVVPFWRRTPAMRRLGNQTFYLALLLDGFILGSMLVEVQGRYHVILYVPLVLLAAMACSLSKLVGHRAN